MRFDRLAIIAAGAIVASTAASQAALMGTATISGAPIGGGVYHYTVTLNNTGTTTIGTLWFAWIPGANFMATVPNTITSPAGWTAQVVGGAGAASILWQAGSVGSRLAAGNSLATFAFNSTSTPEQMAGFAASSPSNHVTTSFLYSGAAFSDAGLQFTVAVVPTPSAAALAGLSVASLARRRRRA